MHLTFAIILTAIIVGAIVGALGRLVVPGRQNIGILATVVVGIVGSIVGTLIAGAIHERNTPGVDWIQIILEVLVAAVGVALVSGSRGGYRRGVRR
jgi:uncharacterized membrane protein YeaQ/YmgE (transglycosylase-associated protein family)